MIFLNLEQGHFKISPRIEISRWRKNDDAPYIGFLRLNLIIATIKVNFMQFSKADVYTCVCNCWLIQFTDKSVLVSS